MSIYPCSICGGRIAGKPVSSFNAWFDTSGNRVAGKQNLCVDCSRDLFAPLVAKLKENGDDVCVCPLCGADASGDLDPTYATVFAPGQESRRFEFATCSGCAPKLREQLGAGARRLPNRDQRVGAAAPTQTPDPSLYDWLS